MTDHAIPRRYGVTGTDTGIGKTVVTCALAARARQLGIGVAAMKPVESGVDARAPHVGVGQPGVMPSDAERLQAACGSADDLSLIRPYVLAEPLAPMVAAQRAGMTLDLGVLDVARAQLERDRELLLVEGAGGLLVPITRDLSYAGLFVRWHCDVILVAGNKLGVLNHVLLTVQAAEQAGLAIAGIVLTALSEQPLTVADATNGEVLRQLLPGHRLYTFPWVRALHDTTALAAAAHAAGLDALLTA